MQEEPLPPTQAVFDVPMEEIVSDVGKGCSTGSVLNLKGRGLGTMVLENKVAIVTGSGKGIDPSSQKLSITKGQRLRSGIDPG